MAIVFWVFAQVRRAAGSGGRPRSPSGSNTQSAQADRAPAPHGPPDADAPRPPTPIPPTAPPIHLQLQEPKRRGAQSLVPRAVAAGRHVQPYGRAPAGRAAADHHLHRDVSAAAAAAQGGQRVAAVAQGARACTTRGRPFFPALCHRPTAPLESPAAPPHPPAHPPIHPPAHPPIHPPTHPSTCPPQTGLRNPLMPCPAGTLSSLTCS
jgi:hypothetical protein